MRSLCAFFIFLLVIAFSHRAQAEGFAVYEWGARSTALGGAVTARKPDPSAVASNPAAITLLPGKQLQLGFSLVMPKGNASFHDPAYGADGDYKLRDEYWPMPSAYYTHELSERLTLGLGGYSRFGLGLDYPKRWPGRYSVHNVELQTFSVTPVAGLQLTDNLSVGLGFEAMYLDIMIKKAVDLSPRLPGNPPASRATDAQSILEGDNWGFGGNLSLHYTVNDNWAMGLIYRSPVQHKVKGEASLEPPAWGGNKVISDARANVTMPESVTAGLAWTPNERWSVEVDATWTRWSRFRYLNIHIDDLPDSYSDRHWKDAWRLGLGVEYYPLEWLALRAGFIWDQCPVTKANEDYLIPTAHRQIYSLGLGFQLDGWSLDLGYGLLNVNERHYASRPGSGVYKSRTHRSLSHLAAVSVSWQF